MDKVSVAIGKILNFPFLDDSKEFWFRNCKDEQEIAFLHTENDDWESLCCHIFSVSYRNGWQINEKAVYRISDQNFESIMAIDEIILESSVNRENAKWRPMLLLYPNFQAEVKKKLGYE